MGRFFTSTQIYNPKQLDRDGFKAYFCEKMKKDGYEVCEADCAELSYVLAFADNCKWVTISSEAYEQGNRTSQADTARIAKMLGTYCVNTIVIDSDCAMLDLYDDKGKKADTLVMGRADDYLGDDIPAPAKAVWEKFLSADSTWEKFISVVQGDYVFVEDGLSELAPVIGMDGGNILFEYEDADESNENFCYLSFRKASSKKEKKLTINAAFKKIYGNALIPLGFKWVKTKEPCFIRVINEKIIHIVGIHDMKPNFIVPFGGATTMYRADLMLNKTYRDTANWLPSVKQFWGWTHTDTDEAPDSRIGSKFYYLINSPDSIEDVVSAALRATIRWIMPALDSVQSLQDFLGYYEMCHNTILPFRTLPLKSTDSGNFEADAVIRYLLGNLSLQFEEYSTEIEKRQALSDAFNPNINTPDNIQYLRNRAKARNEAIHLSVISFENDPEVKQQAIVELQRRKNANLEILKSYGIDFEKPQPKKEKKLTINAAFKQVFGELLESMGFKLVKSKYPYYLRVVGEGIIQAISFAKKKSLNLDLNRDEEEVEIYVGISLLSNPLINFDKNPIIIDNQVWMISLNELYRRFIVYMDVFNRKHEEYSFFYQKGNIEEVLNALKQSRDELMPFVLEFLEKPKTLEDIYRLGEITSGIRHDTIILLQKIDELIKELKENLTKKIEMLESVHKDNPERLELLKKRAIEGSEKSIEYFGSFKKGGEKYDDYIKTAEKTKEENIEKLKSYGIPLE